MFVNCIVHDNCLFVLVVCWVSVVGVVAEGALLFVVGSLFVK